MPGISARPTWPVCSSFTGRGRPCDDASAGAGCAQAAPMSATSSAVAIILREPMRRASLAGVGMSEAASIHPPPRPLKNSRRALLAGAAAAAASAALLAPRRALAIGDHAKLRFARLHLPDLPNPRPTALRRLAWEIERRTSLVTVPEPIE